MLEVKYKCPTGKEARYCCIKEKCIKISVKCIQNCETCKSSHLNCPTEIKIEKLVDQLKIRREKIPVIHQKIHDENLIQKLIDQLAGIKKKYENIDVSKWGLTKYIADILFENSFDKVRGGQIGIVLNKQLNYPDIKLYRPLQFKKDVEFMEKLNNKFESRMLKIHQSYKNLAECECKIKDLHQQFQQKSHQEDFLRNYRQVISEINTQLKKSMIQRFQLPPIIQSDDDQQIEEEQIRIFQSIGEKLFKTLFTMICFYFEKKKYQQTTGLIEQLQKLFEPQRKELALSYTAISKRDLQTLSQKKGYSYFYAKKYQEAYDYFMQLPDQQKTQPILQILVKIFKQLNTDDSTTLSYYERYREMIVESHELKLQTQKSILELQRKQKVQKQTGQVKKIKDELQKMKKRRIYENKNEIKKKVRQIVEIWEKIIQIYAKYYNFELEYKRSKQLNQFVRKNVNFEKDIKQLKEQQVIQTLKRDFVVISYEFNRSDSKNFFLSLSALEFISFFKNEQYYIQSREFLQIHFQIRLFAIRYQYYIKKKEVGTRIRNTLQVWNALEEEYKRMTKKDPRKIKKDIEQLLKKYYIAFAIEAINSDFSKKDKLQVLQKCKKYMDDLRIVHFGPIFELAKLSFDLKTGNALQYQDKSNSIYPTDICYSNKAFLVYRKAKNDQSSAQYLLNQAIKMINRSLCLNPEQDNLYHFRGIVYHDLKKYEESNSDFEKSIGNIQKNEYKIDIKKRMALNFQFIVKRNNNLTEMQRITYFKRSLDLYKQCLQMNEGKGKPALLFGYARMLKFLKRYKQAEQEFIKLKNQTDLKDQVYMYLGNIKQQLGKENDDRNYQLFDEALEYYLLGGSSTENKQNLIRIYKQLGNERKAKQIQQRR